MRAILRKELADYFNSVRFIILFGLVILASATALFADYQGMRGSNLPEGFIFLGLFTTGGLQSLFILLVLIVPIVGITLGFDAINSERSGGTLSRIVAQPIYRDSIINGKFLAGLVILSILVGTTIMLVSGYGLRMIGVPPTAYEIIRLFVFGVLTIAFGAFWMGLAMLFSILLRRVTASLLLSIGILVFSFFVLVIAPVIASAMTPLSQGSSQAEIIRNAEIQRTVELFSPHGLFTTASGAMLLPVVRGSMVLVSSQMASPLSLSQSLVLIWPYFTSLISLSVVCFAISYLLFMRQEIRAT